VSGASRPAPTDIFCHNPGVGRKGAFKDRPLWRRLQTIHHEIKEGRHPNATKLAAALDVSTKTVQRDLDYLRNELAAPIEFDRDENGYFYSRADYVLPFLPVDGRDLFSIGVAAQVLSLFGGTPLGRDLKSCYERLAKLMPPAVRLRPEIVMEKLALRAAAFRPVREETWQAVSESLQRGVALSIRYHRPGEPPGDSRTVKPYSLVVFGRDWMVLALDETDGIVKNFYLARMEDAHPTSQRYTIPRDFDPDAFFRNTFGIFVGGSKPFRFRVRFSKEISEEVRELKFHPKQKLERGAEGEAILELPAESLKEARRFILGYGKDAVALSPPELVEELRKETAYLREEYEKSSKYRVRNPK
jgi:predicted DNA-binding transcriptional regulator YafY